MHFTHNYYDKVSVNWNSTFWNVKHVTNSFISIGCHFSNNELKIWREIQEELSIISIQVMAV